MTTMDNGKLSRVRLWRATAAAGLVATGGAAAWAAVPQPQQTVVGSTAAGGALLDSPAALGSVSDDGRLVAFVSQAGNLPGSNGND